MQGRNELDYGMFTAAVLQAYVNDFIHLLAISTCLSRNPILSTVGGGSKKVR